MKSRYRKIFLLLDFGHPMTKNTINMVKKSLQNILALALVSRRKTEDFDLGISVLNSDFTVIQSFSYLRSNYDLLTKNLDALSKTIKATDRVTVQEYKHMLIASIERLIHTARRKSTENENDANEVRICISVVTKKTASLLAEMLTNMVIKLSTPQINKIKIVQFSNEQDEKNYGISKKNDCLIDWVTCAENIKEIDRVFKDWLLNLDGYREQLEIILSKEIDLVLKCEVEDCMVDTVSSSSSLENCFSRTDHRLPSSNKTLDVLKRIPVTGLCPTVVFGVPRRVYATRSRVLSWADRQTNHQIFKQLCRELLRKEQGLLVKSSIEVEGNQLAIFRFITTDGHMLLMNDVASDELCLPKRLQFPDDPESNIGADEKVASVVEGCLEKISLLQEYIPENFSSGFYDCLRNYLISAGERRSLFGHFDPTLKLFGRNSGKQSTTRKGISKKTAYIPDSNQVGSEKKAARENDVGSSQTRKKQKQKSEVESGDVHPALLSPDVVDKFRRVYPSAFDLPELGQDYNENLF